MPQGETIVAIASGNAPAGIGVLRVSGNGAFTIARELLGRAPVPRHAHYCALRDEAGQRIDRGLLLWFPAPHSYTGEDVVELQAHGSPVLLRLLRERLVQMGARHARPGEFSERAFLNGKLDLAQAEAVADLIASGSEAAARAAQRSLEGAFSERVTALAEVLVGLRCYIEAAFDFPDEEIDFLAAPELLARLATARRDLEQLLAAARRGVRLANGLHVVIVGRPNVGKSSLLNALAASERAIVTEVAGTTRDLLRETIDLDGVALTLVDTAGLRETADAVEREGVRRARAELERADLILLIVDAAAPAPEDAALAAELPAALERIVIHNKIDRAGADPRAETIDGVLHLWLSARRGAGLDLLVAALRSRAGTSEADAGAFSARARHVAALERTRERFAKAQRLVEQGEGAELAAEELRLAHRALGEITGEFSSEDLLGAIFSSFCIGK